MVLPRGGRTTANSSRELRLESDRFSTRKEKVIIESSGRSPLSKTGRNKEEKERRENNYLPLLLPSRKDVKSGGAPSAFRRDPGVPPKNQDSEDDHGGGFSQ